MRLGEKSTCACTNKAFILAIWLIGNLLSLSSCSKSTAFWPPSAGEPLITLVGPIYQTSSGGNYRFPRMLKQAMSELVKNQSELIAQDTDGRLIRVKQVDWLMENEGFLAAWERIQTEAKYKDGSFNNLKVTAILRESAVHKDPYILGLHLVPPERKNPDALELVGYRLINVPDDDAEANMFRITVPIKDKVPKDELVAILLRLIASDDFASPGFGNMGFAFVEGGCFNMGANSLEEKCVDDFSLAKFPVIQHQWQLILKNRASQNGRNGRSPVTNVSFLETGQFIESLNDLTGRSYRLPTEAEWEYACRNRGKDVLFGTKTGEISHRLANFLGRDDLDIWDNTSPVGKFPANTLGLYDMTGNVWEWTQTRHGVDRNPNFIKRLFGSKNTATKRITRGGSFDSPVNDLPCTKKNHAVSSIRTSDIGFRLVLDE